MDVGDLVTRQSYGHDVTFRIDNIIKDKCGNETALLRGIFWRLLADAPLSDLQPVKDLTTCTCQTRRAKTLIHAHSNLG